MSAIAVVGSLNMDLVVRAPRQPILGETVMGYSFGTTGGGKGSNQALACARLGAESFMVGCVGDDDFGQRLRSTLVENKVDCKCLDVRKEVMTGVASITVTDRGDNAIVVVPGANDFVGAPLLERAAPVFRKADIALFQLEIPIPAVLMGLRAAKLAGCRTMLTPAPAKALPTELWSLIDGLILNETELAFYGDFSSSHGDKVMESVHSLLKKGVERVILTKGSKGGTVITKHDSFSYAPFAVNAVDSTGASDAFAAAWAVGLSEGMTPEETARFASAAGALACTRYGAHSSMPRRHEVEELLESGERSSAREEED